MINVTLETVPEHTR